MRILENNAGLSNSLGGVLENILPGSTSSTTLIGNTAGESGVVDDLHGATEGSSGDAVHDAYNDVATDGGVAADAFNGGGIGIEPALSEHLPPIDDIPLVRETTAAVDPVTSVVGEVNGTLVDIGENLSPGISNPYNLMGDVIGQSGIVDDLVTNTHEGSPSGAVLDVYKDVLGPGGILDNIGDGYGSGLESLVHQLNGVEGTLPVLAEVPPLLGDSPDTLANTAEDLSPGATSNTTTTGNLIGPSGVVDDVGTNLSEGSLSGGVVASYDDVFAKGGLINNLADGHGLGTEGLIGNIASLVNDSGSINGVAGGGSLTDVLGHVGALLGEDTGGGSGAADHSDSLGGLLGDHDIAGALDTLHLADHHVA
jgi:hypothetical protein